MCEDKIIIQNIFISRLINSETHYKTYKNKLTNILRSAKKLFKESSCGEKLLYCWYLEKFKTGNGNTPDRESP